jgi:maleylpyruvate isomerase
VSTPNAARSWVEHGTRLFIDTITGRGEEEYNASSLLPGWTRRHLVAHVAANAEALGNLVHWAATGVPTPMYATPEERSAGIDSGRRRPADELDHWLRRSAAELDDAMDRLDHEQWAAEVVTAQGRTVPAAEIPWLRAREIYIHAVDLELGVTFVDLPSSFLEALCTDVVAKRSGTAAQSIELIATDTARRWTLHGPAEAVTVAGALPDIAAYLTGRPHGLGSDPAGPPPLPAWL